MNNSVIQLKIQQRLNKLASQDYDNIKPWQIVEAFNKAQLSWCRRQLHGNNIKQTGDEQSKRRINDLQVILTVLPVKLIKADRYVELTQLPDNFFEWKRISGQAFTKECEDGKPMVIYLTEEQNIDLVLADNNSKPSFKWGETICTMVDNTIRIYTNDEFMMTNAQLMYYRMPRYIEIEGSMDPYTKKISTKDILCEFKDDIIELFIDEAVKILAGDIESFNQQQTAAQQVENNN